MSITNTKAKSVYNANGTTTEWNLGFTYNDTVSNVHIYIVDANDNETEVTSNYSIVDGVLTYPTTASGLAPLAEGNKLVIVRDTPRTQDIELTSNGKLDGKVLEGGYDKLTLQVQELTEQVNRAVKIPVTEDSADNFLDPITAITEAKKEALVEIAQATTPAETAKDTAVAKAQVATEQATIATNAATSAKAAQVGAEQAEQNATAQAEKAENAVTAFVEGLGTAKNAVIDLGTFDGKTSVTSSRIIEFSNTPIAVSLRFSDTNKKLWINGTNSTVGIEVIDNTHCNLFYSIASADFVGQNAVKGPFVVQAIIQYSLLDNSATETEMGAVQLATKAEAEAGTNDTKAMTPLKTKYAIEANATVQTLRNDIDDLGDQVSTIESKVPAEATVDNQLADKAFVIGKTDKLSADIQNINLIKWVDTLPATGETKYLYAVAREEVDKDGKKIAALYLWDGSAWRGAGAFSLNIDPATLATKTELAGYLPLSSKAVANGVASLDENAKVPVAQLPQTVICSNDVLLDSVANTLPIKKIYQQKLDDVLYRADKRYTVTLNNFNQYPDKLFDGNNDTYVSIPEGQTGSILIEAPYNIGGGYPYGYIYVVFYFGCGLRDLSKITCRVYQNWTGHNVGWVTLNAEEVQGQTYSDGTYIIGIVRFRNDSYGITKIELNFDNTEGTSQTETTDLRVNSVSFFKERCAVSSLPVMTKWGANDTYGDLTINNSALKITSPDGTKTSSITTNNNGLISFNTGIYLPATTTGPKGKPIYEQDKGVAGGIATLDVNGKVPTEQIPVATASSLGVVKPDGNTITVTEDGVISVPASSEVATKADLQSLQTQINSLNTEVTGMLGRMNFNARVDFNLLQEQSYTVPSKGYLWIESITDTNSGGYVYINGGILATSSNHDSLGSANFRVFVPVSAGDVLSVSRETPSSTVNVFGFFVPQV